MIPHFPDARRPIDAAPATDAAPELDAGPPRAGTVSIQDVEVLGPTAERVTAAGHGGNITVSFTPAFSAATVGQFTEESAGSFALPPCYAVRYDSMGKGPPTGSDEGAVTWTIAPAGGVVLPACTFSAGTYQCVGASGTMGSIAPSTGAAGTVSTFTDGATAGTGFSAADVGRYFVFAGGAIPIVGFAAGPPALFGLQAANLTVATTGPWKTVAGAGPVALTANPDGTGIGAPPPFFRDADTVTFSKVAGDNIPAGTASTGIITTWDLDTPSKTVLSTGILAAAGSVVIGCNTTTTTNALCGTFPTAAALKGTIIAIDSTDTAPTSAANPFPAPTRHSANITCTQLDSVAPFAVTISQTLINVLKNAQPKVLRISIFRAGLGVTAPMTNFVAGRGFVKFEVAP